MQVIPVIDLMGGVVVRARRGDRSQYAPLCSPLCPTSSPADVARALVSVAGGGDIYVADLDAIAGAPPNWRAYNQIAAAGAVLHLDAGFSSAAGVARIGEFAGQHGIRFRPIVALETLREPCDLEELVHSSAEPITFSLDLMGGTPLTPARAWRSAAPLQIADAVVSRGVRRMIVLDLRRVGGDEGAGEFALCREIRRRHPHVLLWSGGGVRSFNDLSALAAAGCEGALVASALHDRRLSTDDVQRAASLTAASPR